MVIRRIVCVVAVILIASTGACSKKAETVKKPMTTAERDSAIGESKLPGAGVVKRALEQSDSAKARANQPIPEPR